MLGGLLRAAWVAQMLAQTVPPAAGTPALADDYAQAEPMEDLTAPAPAAPDAHAATSVNGYIDSRLTFQRAHVGGLTPTRDLPQIDELIEGNVQLRHLYAASGFVYADASAFGQIAGWYRTQNAAGKEVDVGDHAVTAYQPLFSLNEFYLSQDIVPQLNFMVGKKRIVWGPGFSFNPTDILDPPKDPTNPSFQRAGFWMGRLELNLREWVVTLLAAPQVTEQAAGLPFDFVTYPSWDKRDTQAHYQLAARLYMGLGGADVNLMAFYGNHYNDVFGNKVRLGASFSRYFFTDWELHAEALFQTGSTMNYPSATCLQSQLAAEGCVHGGAALSPQTRLNSHAILPRVLAGIRRVLDDESSMSVEYLFQADGYGRSDTQRLIYLLELQTLMSAASLSGEGAQSTGIPQNFTFNPVGKQYLIASYSKPKIGDDWTLGATVIASLDDLSTFWSPNVAWSVRDWVTLSLYGFIPAPGPNSLAATTTTGTHVSQFTLSNSIYRILFEARIFY